MKKNPNIDTNYYMQRRYDNAEMDTTDISFEPDTGSVMYADYSHDSIYKLDNLKLLSEYIDNNCTIKAIVDKIPNGRVVNLTVEEVNKLYSFCMILQQKNSKIAELTKVEVFDLVTDYLNLDEKEVKNFHKNLSIKFKTELLDELEELGLYKNNRLF